MRVDCSTPPGLQPPRSGVELITALRVNSGSDAISEPRTLLVSLHLAKGYNFAVHLSQVAFALFLASGGKKRWTEFGRLCSQTNVLLRKFPSFVAGCKLSLRSELTANDVYRAVDDLMEAFREAKSRLTKMATQVNIEHVRKLTKQARRLMNGMRSFRTKQIFADHPSPFASLRPAHVLPFTLEDFVEFSVRVEDRLISEMQKERPKGDLSDLEQFIRGPLSDCYKTLFGRDAGGKQGGPFSRFGKRFFDTFGFSVSASTIVRSLRERTGKATGG